MKVSCFLFSSFRIWIFYFFKIEFSSIFFSFFLLLLQASLHSRFYYLYFYFYYIFQLLLQFSLLSRFYYLYFYLDYIFILIAFLNVSHIDLFFNFSFMIKFSISMYNTHTNHIVRLKFFRTFDCARAKLNERLKLRVH